MVTGENIVTATAIAKECNILGKEVDLKNLGPNEIEQDPKAINDNIMGPTITPNSISYWCRRTFWCFCINF